MAKAASQSSQPPDAGAADTEAEKKPAPAFKPYKEAKYKNNVPGQPLGSCFIPKPIPRMIKPDEEFTVPYYIEPRNGWLPLDEAAKQRFEEFNADLLAGKIKAVEDHFAVLVRRHLNAERPVYVDTPECLAKFRKSHLRRPNAPTAIVKEVDQRRKQELLDELAKLEMQEKEAAESRAKSTQQADELTSRNGSTRTADQ